MQTVTQTLERANTIYHTSVQKEALAEQAQALRALLAQGWLNERNRENAEALLWRVQAKELALAYFTEGYNEDDYAALAAYCAEKQPEAEQKGYGNTAQLLERLGAFAARAHAVMADAAAEAASLGIAPERAADYVADGRGTGVLYDAMACAVAEVRACPSSAAMGNTWRAGLDADVRARRR